MTNVAMFTRVREGETRGTANVPPLAKPVFVPINIEVPAVSVAIRHPTIYGGSYQIGPNIVSKNS